MLRTEAQPGLLVLSGELGYDEIAGFEEACEELLRRGARPVTVDLAGVRLMSSPCVTRVYDLARRIGFGQVTLRVPVRLRHVFAPGEVHGLFRIEAEAH